MTWWWTLLTIPIHFLLYDLLVFMCCIYIKNKFSIHLETCVDLVLCLWVMSRYGNVIHILTTKTIQILTSTIYDVAFFFAILSFTNIVLMVNLPLWLRSCCSLLPLHRHFLLFIMMLIMHILLTNRVMKGSLKTH